MDNNRFVNVRWADSPGVNYYANIDIEAVNSSGILNKVIELVNNEKLNLAGISTKEFDDTIRILIKVEVKNSEQADNLVKKVKTIPGVFYSIRY
jgi:(p)ppGpp synthase/HD superfamily hydrolase